MSVKKKDYVFANKQMDLNSISGKIGKRILFYWRLLLYYKCFNNFFELPDSFFFIFPDNNTSPIRETTNSGEIVTLGLVDTNSNYEYLHYPIIINDDSLLIICFFITLICNIFIEAKVNIFKNKF